MRPSSAPSRMPVPPTYSPAVVQPPSVTPPTNRALPPYDSGAVAWTSTGAALYSQTVVKPPEPSSVTPPTDREILPPDDDSGGVAWTSIGIAFCAASVLLQILLIGSVLKKCRRRVERNKRVSPK
jgi:hypothetical protein